MDPVTVSTTIGRPREEVFEYLADIANHPEFTDHFLVDWHLTREDSYGRGAGARFRVEAPLQRFNLGRHHAGRGRAALPDRRGRDAAASTTASASPATYTLTEGAAGTTEVEMITETEPALLSDRLMEAAGHAALVPAQGAAGHAPAALDPRGGRGRGAGAPTIAGR